MSGISVEIQGLDKAMRSIDSGTSGAGRRKILQAIGRQVLKNTRKRTQTQTDLNGGTYKAHARGRKRKMLTRLTRAKNMNLVSASENHVLVGFKNRVQEMIAAKQQFGHVEQMSAEKMRQRKGTAPRSAQATRTQAKALLKEGYKTKQAGRAYKSPSIKWITQNMRVGHAGVILRAMRGSKENWKTTLPARSFLGIKKTEQAELVAIAIEQARKNIGLTT